MASQKQQSLKTAQAKAAALTAAVAVPASSTPDKNGPAQAAPPAAAPPKTTIADWTGDGDNDDVNGFYGEKRQRGGRKKRKKNRQEAPAAQNWDDIYDPSRPNTYEAYKNSDEKIREIRDWKDRLYAHRMARRHSDYSDSDDDRPVPRMNSTHRPSFASSTTKYQLDQFAPPSMGFAPPPSEPTAVPAPLPAPGAPVPDDPTGEDAYARRLRMSQQASNSSPQSQPPPPPSFAPGTSAAPPPPPPPTEQHTISRAPVRYNFPAAPVEIPRSEAELEDALQAEQEDTSAPSVDDDAAAGAPRSLRPGQKGFAERLMGKYGWTKGSGLGANNSGILNPLRVKLEKQKKRPDAEGGGVIGPSGGIGKIIGGQRKKVEGEEEGGKFGPMSEVVMLRGMVAGMDLDYELSEGNLMQEIGEECGEKVSVILSIVGMMADGGAVWKGREGIHRKG